MANGDAVEMRLEADRKGLLDLTLRNPLLNYRPRARGLEVVGESPAALFRILVREGRAMSFVHDPRAVDDEEGGEKTSEESPPPPPTVDPNDTKLQTGVSARRLEDRLLAIYHAARTSIEEQGVNTLYLALGMLTWAGADDPKRHLRAPMVLVPVALERSGARERFRLRHDGGDPGDNLSLAEKLRAEHLIELPELPDEEDDLGVFFDAAAAAIRGRDGWKVDRESAVLGFFSFGKFLMYRDLDAAGWPEDARPGRHPILRSLLGDGFAPPLGGPAEDEARSTDPSYARHVVDADGSQAEAIRAVEEGGDLVIQGPPGTGKSQTITNAIAGAIARGRSVLFVAEKMAALEVVKRRLDAIGLGDACLELHSHKASKKAVLAELRRTLELGRPRLGAIEEDGRLLREHVLRLDGYAEAVNGPIGPSGFSPHDAIGELVRLGGEVDLGSLPRPDLPGLSGWSGYDFRRRLGLVGQLQARLPAVGVPDQHPFRGSRRTLIHPAEGERLRSLVDECRRSLADLRDSAGRLAGVLRLSPPASMAEAEMLVAAARRAAEGVGLQGVDVRDEDWTTRRAEVRDLIDAGSELAGIRGRLDPLLLPEAWDQDLSEARRDLNLFGRRWWRFFSGAYRRAGRRLAGLLRGAPLKGLDERLAVVDAVIRGRGLRQAIGRGEAVGSRLFGPRWRGEASDWSGLGEVTSWVEKLREDVRSRRLPAGLLDSLAAPADPAALDRATGAVGAALIAFPGATGRIAAFLEFDPARPDGAPDRLAFDDLEGRLGLWASKGDTLKDLAAWNHSAEACRLDDLGGVVELAESWPGAVEQLTRAFERRWFEGLLEVAVAGRPALAGFDGRGHDREIEAFRALDRRGLVHARSIAASEHWKRLPRHEGGGQLGVLRREFEKKARHLPLRQLLTRAGNAVRAIKPVFMMSPLSVAAYLAPGQVRFDLVVFDEASQVRPVDALGALLRAGQAVVVGDSRQLPPTRFFDRLVGGDDGDDEAEPATSDVESVLGLFLAQGSPERMLRWHYRSRHESLIAVSNREFYDGRLVVFPSPDADRREAGLILRHLPSTIYDRGNTRTNPGEAEAVAAAAMDHAREQLARPAEGRRTLGVAAFSVAQMRAILDRLERLRRDDPSCEPFFAEGGAEPFFVKNLENVQGDERDVIFISLGYGRTASGDVAMAFGPLNAEGGERRLNVLITRARARCEVFTNITAEDIDLSRTQARGVRALKTFLAFAGSGRLDEPGGAAPESPPFEAAVRAALAREGHEVRAGVGSSQARIDLAVEDPTRPGRYLLGIECDGATYRESRPARDRDRLRPQVLGSLGWKLHRAWSPDWWRDPEGALDRALAAIDAARAPAILAPDPASTSEADLGGEGPEAPERSEVEETGGAAAGAVPPYRFASIAPDLRGKELHEVPPRRLAGWASEVVRVEGPVHVSEVARRIAEAAGVKRIGTRIQAALDAAFVAAARRGDVNRAGDFLSPPGQVEPPIRDRSDLPAASKKAELVAPEEIGRAIERVVSDALGMEPDAIPLAACRLLGFARMGDDMRRRVEAIRDDLVARGRLATRGDHLVVPDPQATPCDPKDLLLERTPGAEPHPEGRTGEGGPWRT